MQIEKTPLRVLAAVLFLCCLATPSFASAAAPTREAGLRPIADYQAAPTRIVPRANTIYVPDNASTISAAVAQAGTYDTIMVRPGTYREHVIVSRKYVQIISTNGPGSTIIDGTNNGTPMVFDNTPYNGALPRLSGFTIQNGNGQAGQGGGMTFQNNGDGLVDNNTFTNNYVSGDGGAIIAQISSHPIIRNNTFTNNKAVRFGGAILVVTKSMPTIYSNTFSGNIATGAVFSGGGSAGGAIFVDSGSAPRIIANTFTNNKADFAGGAIFFGGVGGNPYGQPPIVEDNTFTSNSAPYGGAIHNETIGGAVTIINNNLNYNSATYSSSYGAGYGGAISIYNQSRVTLMNNHIGNNFASQGGGGIVCSENAVATINSNYIGGNSTVTDSSFDNGGAGPPAGGGILVSACTATITNNVIYKDSARLGGGIGVVVGTATINNNTIVSNQGSYVSFNGQGGGLFVQTGSNVNVVNNILALNNGFQIFESQHKAATYTNNLINNDGKGIYFNFDSNGINDINSFNGNANTNAAGNISGATNFNNAGGDDYNITAGSAAIDRGSTSISINKDILNRRRSTAGSSPDIGAFEYTGQAIIKTAVWRFTNLGDNANFYTINPDGRNYYLSAYPLRQWLYLDRAFWAYPDQAAGTVPVYRFHYGTTDHYGYSTDANAFAGWTREKVAFYAYNQLNVVPGASPNNVVAVYDYVFTAYNEHYYSTDPNFAQNNSGWQSQGLAWYSPS